MFIGYYNLANFITLFGMASSVCSAMFAILGRTGHNPIFFKLAVLALLLAGLSDTFDGKVARHANRQDRKAKMFGIQIDTVCDMVSFGVAPVVIAFSFGLDEWYDFPILVFYAACGAIRLAYFNTQAIMETEDLNLRVFTGVPIPTICFVMAPLSVFLTFIDGDIMSWVTRFFYVALGFLYISKLKIKKPSTPVISVIVTVLLAAAIVMMCLGNFKLFF